MKSILIVEQASIVRDPLAAALRAAGYRVEASINGSDALRRISDAPPDLVLTELNLPVVDGLSLLRTLRGQKQTVKLPVIVLSSVSAKEQVLEAASLKIHGYILKSKFSFEALLQRLSEILNEPLPAAVPSEATRLNESVRVEGAAQSASPGESAPANAPSKASASARATPSTGGDDADEDAEDPELVITPPENPVEALKSLKPIKTRSEVTDIIDTCCELRALSPVVQEVLSLTGSERCSIEQVAKAISRDHAIALKVLKLANSAVYTRGEPVDSVKTAVMRIGLQEIRQAVLNIAVVEQYSSEELAKYIDPGQFWEHAIACGVIAAEIAHQRNSKEADSAFAMGLLHDVGRMIFAEQFGDAYITVLETARQMQLPVEQVESRLLLYNHADVMDRVLHAWKFPKQLINPIVFHHLSAGNIRSSAPRELTEVATLGLANRLAHALLLGSSGNETIYPTEELSELLKIKPETVSRIEATTREETDKMKFSLLSRSDGTNWVPLRDQIQKKLPKPFNPLYVSASPALDAHRILCDQLRDAGENDLPNIAIMYIRHARERVALTTALRTGEQEANVSNLPLLVISPTGALIPEGSLLQARTFRTMQTPMALNRFLGHVTALLSEAPAEVAAAA